MPITGQAQTQIMNDKTDVPRNRRGLWAIPQDPAMLRTAPATHNAYSPKGREGEGGGGEADGEGKRKGGMER